MNGYVNYQLLCSPFKHDNETNCTGNDPDSLCTTPTHSHYSMPTCVRTKGAVRQTCKLGSNVAALLQLAIVIALEDERPQPEVHLSSKLCFCLLPWNRSSRHMPCHYCLCPVHPGLAWKRWAARPEWRQRS